MDHVQRAVCRELLRLSYARGFEEGFDLTPIAAELNIGEVLYDPDTETGSLAELVAKGYLSVSHGFGRVYASVCFEMRDLLENWSREPVAPSGDGYGDPRPVQTIAEVLSKSPMDYVREDRERIQKALLDHFDPGRTLLSDDIISTSCEDFHDTVRRICASES